MTAHLLRFLTRLQSLIWIWLLALCATIIWGVGDVVQGVSYGLLVVVALGGLLVGGLLARIRTPWGMALILLAGSGFETILVLVGRLLPPVLALLRALAWYLAALFIALWRGKLDGLPEIGPLWVAARDLVLGGSAVLGRLAAWFGSLGQTGVTDPLPVPLIWGWALWLAAGLAAYFIWRERQAVLAVTPLGTLLAVTVYFTGASFELLLLFLLLALALQAGVSWKRRQRRWEATGLDYATDLYLDLIFAVTPLIVAIVTLSLITPQVSLRQLTSSLYRLLALENQRVDDVATSFGLEAQNRRFNFARPPSIAPSGLPRQHLLGSGPELSEQIVMAIRTNDPPPDPQEFGDVARPPAYYWLSASYDAYTTLGWASTRTTNTELAANEPLVEPVGPGREITQTVRRLGTVSLLLHTAGFPLQVDRPATIARRSGGDWAGTTLQTETYVARSWLSQASADQLRAAGTDYPDLIVKRYLELPDSLPGRVRALALELTATASTPYDRALAIEKYLRAIPYSLDVPAVPPGRDVADYFLFDLQAGYCDYYATSMTVLARAAGLPARFVIGYAPSPYDYETGHYIVRESEAHSWTQIYFPGYGWIDFEPTGGRAAINRDDEEAAALPGLPPDFDLSREGLPVARTHLPVATARWWSVTLLSLIGLLATGGLAVWLDGQRLARLPVEGLVPLLEGRLERSAQLLGIDLPDGLTPLEFESKLLAHLAGLVERWPVLQKIPPSAVDVNRLIQAFVYLRYAPGPAVEVDGAACLAAWRRLRWRLWGAIVIQEIGRLTRWKN